MKLFSTGLATLLLCAASSAWADLESAHQALAWAITTWRCANSSSSRTLATPKHKCNSAICTVRARAWTATPRPQFNGIGKRPSKVTRRLSTVWARCT